MPDLNRRLSGLESDSLTTELISHLTREAVIDITNFYLFSRPKHRGRESKSTTFQQRTRSAYGSKMQRAEQESKTQQPTT